MKFRLTWIVFFLALLSVCSHTSAQNISWTQVAPGVWKGVTGKPEAYDLLKAAGSSPNKEALSKMKKSEFPLMRNKIFASLRNEKFFSAFLFRKMNNSMVSG
jgi:alpha-D-xyloside xylohydrolase